MFCYQCEQTSQGKGCQTVGSSISAAYATIHEVLNALTEPQSVEGLLGLGMKVGELNYAVLEQLEQGCA
jgi:hypothetical protein